MVVITLRSKSSNLYEHLQEIIELDKNSEWEIGLINFCSYNSIANVNKGTNSSFKYGDKLILLDTGAYELEDIIKSIKHKLNYDEKKNRLIIRANANTMKIEIYSDKPIDLTRSDSIAKILGFDNVVLQANKWHYSKHLVNISSIDGILVECNLACGSYFNGKEKHIIYEFLPKVPSGYLINEVPSPIIYVPLNTRRIQTINVKVTDQNGSFIDFRGDTITIRLHIREKQK
jgi:hypothetical protein